MKANIKFEAKDIDEAFEKLALHFSKLTFQRENEVVGSDEDILLADSEITIMPETKLANEEFPLYKSKTV